jgi:hypothetical protein
MKKPIRNGLPHNRQGHIPPGIGGIDVSSKNSLLFFNTGSEPKSDAIAVLYVSAIARCLNISCALSGSNTNDQYRGSL